MIVKLLKEWGAFVILFVLLTTTSLGTEIASYAQRVILMTGIVTPDEDAIPEDELQNFDYNFTVKDIATGKVVNASEYKGKLIFLNLWATWCPPCRAEMPGIQKLYEDIDNDNIVFLMLSLDRKAGAAEKYINDKEFTFPSYTLSGSPTQQIAVPSLPTTYVISPEGKIIQKETGMKKYNTKSFKRFLENNASN